MDLSLQVESTLARPSVTEISVKGNWVTVPAVTIVGQTVITTGRLLKIAAISDSYWIERDIDNPELYIEGLKSSDSKCPDIFTFLNRLPETQLRYPYHVRLNSNAAITLTTYEEWLKKLSTDTRRNIKLAKSRGVVTEVESLSKTLVKGIVTLNNEAPIRAGKPFWHYGKGFEAVMKDYSSFADRSEYMCAYFGGELIAFVKIVYCGTVAAIMQNLAMIAHRDKKPSIALMAKAVERCTQRGLSHLTYLQYRYGTKQDDSLTEFKRRCGFEEIFTPQYYVPLTIKGKAALASGLHRPLGEIVPGPVMVGMLRLRKAWYERTGK